MSADRWSICPKCKSIPKDRVKISPTSEELFIKAAEAYGKVSAKEYETALMAARIAYKKEIEEDASQVEETLRQDYYIGINDSGLFEVNFSSSCSNCGYKFNYNHKEKLGEKKK